MKNVATILFIALKCFRDKHIHTPGLQKKTSFNFLTSYGFIKKITHI